MTCSSGGLSILPLCRFLLGIGLPRVSDAESSLRARFIPIIVGVPSPLGIIESSLVDDGLARLAPRLKRFVGGREFRTEVLYIVGVGS